MSAPPPGRPDRIALFRRDAVLYGMRNHLAHTSLPDVDEDTVWRDTVLLAEQQYQRATRAALTRP